MMDTLAPQAWLLVARRYLLDGAQPTAEDCLGGAVMLIQHFGSAANLINHLDCLVLDGVHPCGADGLPSFVEPGETD